MGHRLQVLAQVVVIVVAPRVAQAGVLRVAAGFSMVPAASSSLPAPIPAPTGSAGPSCAAATELSARGSVSSPAPGDRRLAPEQGRPTGQQFRSAASAGWGRPRRSARAVRPSGPSRSVKPFAAALGPRRERQAGTANSILSIIRARTAPG